MGISDEIEDATIAIDEAKISAIETTKGRFRDYCVQTKYKSARLKKLYMKLIISHLIHNQT